MNATATTTAPPPVAQDAPAGANATASWAIGAPRLLAGIVSGQQNGERPLSWPEHLAVHGPMPATDRDHLLAHLDAVGLAGRGGAGFPLAAKIPALPGAGEQVIVNGAESEPASYKDRVLLRRSPHLVLDGALAVAAAVRARRVTVAVHDRLTADRVRAAAAERPRSPRIEVRVIDGGYVSGEARAVVRALAGGPALPPGRRTPPTAHGVLLTNTETLAQVAVLLRLGTRRFAETGTRDEPGTTLLTVGGAVGRPGVVEVPLGTPLSIVLGAAAAAPPAALVVGGYQGGWLPSNADVAVSRAGLAAAGATLGAGVLLVLDGATCALGELARVTSWLARESAKQCGPCRFGLPALAADVDALARGWPTGQALPAAFRHAAAVTGRGACAHPDGAARFVTSGLRVLDSELHRHAAGGCGRPVLGRLPVEAVA